MLSTYLVDHFCLGYPVDPSLRVHQGSHRDLENDEENECCSEEQVPSRLPGAPVGPAGPGKP